MTRYALFGGCLDSDLAFPELRECNAGAPCWRLRRVPGPLPDEPWELLGEAEVEPGVKVRLFEGDRRFRLVYDDTGTYDISIDGTEICWAPAPEPSEDLVRLDVMGRVMAVALHAAGAFCLHASAVATADGSIAFLGPKFHGKSSLAMAMTEGGAKLLTDDALPVAVDADRVVARPGVHAIRLWRDAADQLSGPDAHAVDEAAPKWTIRDLPADHLMTEASPLLALYLLQPTKPTAGLPAVRRTRIPPVYAAAALVGHNKLGALLGHREAPVVLERAADVARVVPVYRLDVVRDFAELPAVVTRLQTWITEDARRMAAGVRTA